ncbi:PPOX class F420-dependent oxidoreductase [Sporichthya brevicatena]|uniref:PPOX class F420-dependent oxidoreductase n=1 Tax=Sporichthya brevicatena TaxID=171442 RepID=A0ABP3SGN5_9ACTN
MGYTAAPEGWWQDFVGGTPARTAKLAVVRADGSPQVVPVWTALDRTEGRDEIVFTTGADTVKGKAIARDPRVSLCWDDERPPFNFVMVRGTATTSADLDEVYRWAGILGARYMGADRESEYAERNGVPGELVVRVRVDHVVAKVDVAN